MTNPFNAEYGTLVLYAWVGTDPRDGGDMPFLCLATPGDGAAGHTADESMRALARSFGLDSRPGSMTPRPDPSLYLTIASDGWTQLAVPSGERVGHPGSSEWRPLLRRKGEAALVLSYLPLLPGMEDMLHADRTTSEGACVLTVVPLR